MGNHLGNCRGNRPGNGRRGAPTGDVPPCAVLPARNLTVRPGRGESSEVARGSFVHRGRSSHRPPVLPATGRVDVTDTPHRRSTVPPGARSGTIAGDA
ncbi:hypothetical protein ACFPM0_18345 [Pseudonocardia sulfidoxydans]|uniref:hypothetical protein n=1 Tax=Pseudonocardia sulfidoxydans TaxID=54011 RepID=UPI00361E8A37